MNWQAIKDKYPKAWKALEEFAKDWFSLAHDDLTFKRLDILNVTEGHISYSADSFEHNIAIPMSMKIPRDLCYDFFDSKGQMVSVKFANHMAEGVADETFFWAVLRRDDYLEIEIEEGHEQSRTLAESAAFEKAFEILEQQLT